MDKIAFTGEGTTAKIIQRDATETMKRLTFELGGMVKFVGLEDRDELFGQTDDLKAAYLEAVRENHQQLEAIVERNGCERVLIDTNESPRDQLIDYLNKRSLIGRGR